MFTKLKLGTAMTHSAKSTKPETTPSINSFSALGKLMVSSARNAVENDDCGVIVILPAAGQQGDFVIRFVNDEVFSLVAPTLKSLIQEAVISSEDELRSNGVSDKVWLAFSEVPLDTSDKFFEMIQKIDEKHVAPVELEASSPSKTVTQKEGPQLPAVIDQDVRLVESFTTSTNKRWQNYTKMAATVIVSAIAGVAAHAAWGAKK